MQFLVLAFFVGYLLGTWHPAMAGGNDNVTPPTAAAAVPASKLLNFNSPDRVPNEYAVQFKSDDKLQRDVVAAKATLLIEPTLLPNSAGNIQRLATAMSAAYKKGASANNKILTVWTLPGMRGFVIANIAEADIIDLAKDPRIESVEPSMTAHTT